MRSLAAGATQRLGTTELIDINEIFSYTAQTVGGESFGIPRIPDNHKPTDLPIDFVKFLWSKLLPVIEQYCETPSEWSILFGWAIQKVLSMRKGVIDPGLALSIVMESAVPMSKVNIKSL